MIDLKEIKQKTFAEVYEESVKEALSMLGQHMARVIILYVNEKYSIRLVDTLDNPKALTEALKSSLDGGTKIIQRRILRILYEKMEIEPYFTLTMNFEEKILAAKQEYMKKKIERVNE
jgi:uncharacterized protein (DUF1778 family)